MTTKQLVSRGFDFDNKVLNLSRKNEHIMVLEPDNTQIYGFNIAMGGLTEIASKIGIETSNTQFIQPNALKIAMLFPILNDMKLMCPKVQKQE